MYIKQVEVLFSIEENIIISIIIYSKLRPSLSLRFFYDPWLQYIANQSGSGKETASLKIGKNIEILILYVWGRKTGFWLVSIIIIKLWWINIKIEFKYIQRNIFTVSAVYLFKSFGCISFLVKQIAKKKFLPTGGPWLFLISHGQWIGNEQLFKVGSTPWWG